MLLYIFLLKININQSVWNTISIKNNPPIFLMAFAPWCHFCKLALPLWTEFEDSILDDPNIIVGKINCSSDESLCQTLHVRGFPTYITHYNNETKQISIYHKKESYQNVYHRLSKLYQGILIKNFTGIFLKYPSFIFSMSIDNLEARRIATSAVSSLSYVKETKFFFNFSKTNTIHFNSLIKNETLYINNETSTKSFPKDASLRVYLETNYSILMEETFDIQNIYNFITEFINPLFGEWSFQTILPLKRPFILAIPSLKESGFFDSKKKKDEKKKIYSRNIQMFHEAAIQTQKEFAWGKIDSLGFSKASNLFNIQKKDLPTLIIIEMKEHRFIKLTKVNSLEKIHENLNKFKNKSLNYEPLKINYEGEEIIFLKDLFEKFLIILLVLLFLTFLILISLLFYFYRKPIPKTD